MEYYKYISKTETDTKSFAKKFAKNLDKNLAKNLAKNLDKNLDNKLNNKIEEKFKKTAVIVLTGELGSGKTKFVEGFLSFYQLENEISSPTFTIVNEYKNKDINIYHFDVYRLEDSFEFYEIGGEEYFSSGICLIEWGELIKDALPKNYIHITFEKDINDENIRILNIQAIGDYDLEFLKK